MTQSHRPVGPGDHVFLVDGSSFVFRAYFQSIRQDQKYNYRSDRLPVGAVRLFAAKVLQFLRDGAAGIKPTHLAIIFDKSENSFRRELYPAYKAHRPDPPEDLVPQFPLMRDDRARLRPDADRAGPLRGRRPDRDLCPPGARARRRRADRLRRQGPDAVDRARASRCSTRPRATARSGASARRGARLFRRRPDKVVDIQALAGNSDRQRAGRAGHRRQDRGAADQRIRRSRNAARARRRDQAAQAPGDADQPGDRRAGPHLEEAGHAGARRRGRNAARRRSACPNSRARS